VMDMVGLDWTPLSAAVTRNRTQVVRVLLEHGVSVPSDALLDLGAAEGDTVQLLIDAGADVNAKSDAGELPIHEAGTTSALAALLEAGAQVDAPDADGWTALMQAAEGGDIEIVTFLLAAGAATDLQTDSGETAISLARSMGYHELAAMIARH